jgi:hypothetical protein
MKRLSLATLLVLPGLAVSGSEGVGLPARMLTIEWRWVALAPAVQSGVLSTQAAPDGTALGTARSAPPPVQRLQVMNGEAALLQTTRWQALTGLTLLRSAKDGDAAALQTAWLPVVERLNLRPRWPGGTQPVTVQVSAEGRIEAQDAEPAEARQLDTTVRLPLGQWVGVALSGTGAGSPAPAGAVSTQDVARSRGTELQLRISAP